jgi:ABC-type sulfate/molybdate transport systems ATPase subunit
MNWEIDRASSGERQRLAILRVLDIQPEALLLDEPTANLDAKSIRLVERLLESYRKEQQCATLFVSHDPVQRQRVSERSFEIHQGTLRQESTWT